MCDYSLHAIRNRLANEGDQLFIHMFHTGSKGLASVTDLSNSTNRPPQARACGRDSNAGLKINGDG
jgi:hypothetical protein